MDGLNVAQLVVSTLAATLIATPLMVMAYVAGRRSNTPGRHHRFEQLRPEASLGGTVWHAEFDGDTDPQLRQSGMLELSQTGSRIVAAGRMADGTQCTLEGVIHQGRMCCISIDENSHGVWLGTVTAELLAGERQMTGMRTRWAPNSQTLAVRKATFHRAEIAISGSVSDVDPR